MDWIFSVLSESTRNAEIRDAYAVNERENRQIVNKSVAIYNKKNWSTAFDSCWSSFQIIDDFRPSIQYKKP